MAKYKVGMSHEVAGYTVIEADSPEEAEEKGEAMLDDIGEDAIKDVSHREYCITETPKEIK